MMIRLVFPAVLVALLLLRGDSAPAASKSPLEIAQRYIGLNERHNARQLNRMLGVNVIRVAWCAAFASFVMRKAGRKLPRGSNLARSWLAYGHAVKLASARAGDVVVLARHVGIYSDRSKGQVCLISGNSKNQIRKSCYPARWLRGIRR